MLNCIFCDLWFIAHYRKLSVAFIRLIVWSIFICFFWVNLNLIEEFENHFVENHNQHYNLHYTGSGKVNEMLKCEK